VPVPVEKKREEGKCELGKADRRGIRCVVTLYCPPLDTAFVVPLEGMYFHGDTA